MAASSVGGTCGTQHQITGVNGTEVSAGVGREGRSMPGCKLVVPRGVAGWQGWRLICFVFWTHNLELLASFVDCEQVTLQDREEVAIPQPVLQRLLGTRAQQAAAAIAGETVSDGSWDEWVTGEEDWLHQWHCLKRDAGGYNLPT